MPFVVSLNICSVGEGISCTLRAVHKAQVVSLTEHALSDLLMHNEDESCLKEIPVERELQQKNILILKNTTFI